MVPVVLVVPVVPVVDPPAPAAAAAPTRPATGAINGAKLVTASPPAGMPPLAIQSTQSFLSAADRLEILLSWQRHSSLAALTGVLQFSGSTAAKAELAKAPREEPIIKTLRNVIKQSPTKTLFLSTTSNNEREPDKSPLAMVPFRQIGQKPLPKFQKQKDLQPCNNPPLASGAKGFAPLPWLKILFF